MKQLVICLVFCFLYHSQAEGSKLTVAVASNFYPTFKALMSDFERLHPNVQLVVVSGSSGKLYAQIKQGAPFDIFLSADQDKPSRLSHEGLADANSSFTYALGKLVLWRSNPNVSVDETDLRTLSFRKLAIANSKLAPYGFASEQVLARLGVLTQSRLRWVQGENISQTYQFASSGNADLAFVAKSQVWRNGQILSGSAWIIPDELYEPIRQDAVILQRASNKPQAKVMIRFLKGSTVRDKLKLYGYQSSLSDINLIGNGVKP